MTEAMARLWRGHEGDGGMVASEGGIRDWARQLKLVAGIEAVCSSLVAGMETVCSETGGRYGDSM